VRLPLSCGRGRSTERVRTPALQAIFNALFPTSPWLTLEMVVIPSAVWDSNIEVSDPNDTQARRKILAMGRMLLRAAVQGPRRKLLQGFEVTFYIVTPETVGASPPAWRNCN
jgi:hypothetical protein